MAPDTDKSLLDRLQALRGATQRQPPAEAKVDLIERKGTPTREDALTARLKSLRDGASSSAPAPVARPPAPRTDDTGRGTPNSVKKRPESAAVSAPKKDAGSCPPLKKPVLVEEEEEEEEGYEDDVDLAFRTDDQTLQELLEDVSPEDGVFPASHHEPRDEDVRRLLEELATSIPKDDADAKDVTPRQRTDGDDYERSGRPDPDEDSDGEDMKRDVDDVIARFRDEIELEKAQSPESSPPPSPPPNQINSSNKATAGTHQDEDDQEPNPASASPLPSLPAVPDSLSPLPSPNPTNPNHSAASDMDSLTTRLSALRAPTSALDLPDVPTSKPAKPPRRLETTTGYADDDVDSWCTVCLEDATLRCTGCVDEGTGQGEPYCARCWGEMHVGPAAGYEERGHKAVVFNKKEGKKKKTKKVAIGAS